MNAEERVVSIVDDLIEWRADREEHIVSSIDGVPDDYDDRLHDITWRWRDILGRISALEHGTQGGAA